MVAVSTITLRIWLKTLSLPAGLDLVIESFAVGANDIGAKMRRAPIEGMTGLLGTKNVQGEDVATMDDYSNDKMKFRMEMSGVVHAYVSEEDPGPTFFRHGTYDVYTDPLDGSSGIPVGVPVGSIIAIYEHKGEYNDPAALLRPGREMIAAAYVLYGSCTSLVITIDGFGVQGFTLDPKSEEFVLTHPDIRFPEKVAYRSINDANSGQWEPAFKVAWETSLPVGVSDRYIGGLVPDFNRNLLRGGVFGYPGDKKNPRGKLRIMYEEAPIAKIAQNASGLATNGCKNTLDIVPTEIHQRDEFLVGPEPIVRQITDTWTNLRPV